MKNKISINVSTSALKEILADDPQVLVELNSMACEKIAEELKRKSEGIAKQKVDAMLDGLVSDHRKKMEAKYHLPAAAKDKIWEQTQTYMDTHISNARKNISHQMKVKTDEQIKIAVGALQQGIDELYNRKKVELESDIRAMARQEFFDVLKEAKESNLS